MVPSNWLRGEYTGLLRKVQARNVLTDVTVASYQTAAAAPSGDLPTNQVSLRFTKIETEYTPVKPDGSLGVPIKEGWDLTTNRAV
jgi:type VI protein secretion system component Hcp